MGLIRRYTLESVPYFAASVETLRGVLLMWEQGIGRYDIPAGDGLHWDGNKEVLFDRQSFDRYREDADFRKHFFTENQRDQYLEGRLHLKGTNGCWSDIWVVSVPGERKRQALMIRYYDRSIKGNPFVAILSREAAAYFNFENNTVAPTARDITARVITYTEQGLDINLADWGIDEKLAAWNNRNRFERFRNAVAP